MKRSPKVSIIVPVYNASVYLESCLETLSKQTYLNYEVLLINDGSTDNSLDICVKYSNIYNNFITYSQVNKGVSSARNYGLKKASGEWITFVDSDDAVDKNYLEVLTKGIKNVKHDLIISGYYINYVYEQYHILKIPEIIYSNTLQEKLFSIERKGLFNSIYSKLYKKCILSKHDIMFDEKLNNGEDLVFNCEYYKHVTNVQLIDQAAYHYKKRDISSLVNKYNENLEQMVKNCNQARFDLYSHLNMFTTKKYTKLYGKKYIEYISSLIPNMYRSNSQNNFFTRRKKYKKIVNDSFLKEYINYKYDGGFLFKLFVLLSRIGSPSIFEIVYNTLFTLKRIFSDFYKRIRKVMNKSNERKKVARY